jgi:hypothetical protein
MTLSATGLMVRLPETQGGLMSLDEALDVINSAREGDASETSE